MAKSVRNQKELDAIQNKELQSRVAVVIASDETFCFRGPAIREVRIYRGCRPRLEFCAGCDVQVQLPRDNQSDVLALDDARVWLFLSLRSAPEVTLIDRCRAVVYAHEWGQARVLLGGSARLRLFLYDSAAIGVHGLPNARGWFQAEGLGRLLLSGCCRGRIVPTAAISLAFVTPGPLVAGGWPRERLHGTQSEFPGASEGVSGYLKELLQCQ